MYTRSFLFRLKKKALRQKIWYKSIDKIEQGIFNLTIKVVDKVNSIVLGLELLKIVQKIEDKLKVEFLKRIQRFGYNRTRELAHWAIKWGSKLAIGWVLDHNFARYVTMLDTNVSSL